MNIEKEYKGIFWVGGEHDNWKNGILKYLNGVSYVEIFGSFDENPIALGARKRKKICHIYGRLDNSQTCVLNECKLHISNAFFLTTTINFEELYYASTDILVEKKVDFKRVKFKFDCLDNWIDYDAFETVWNGNTVAGVSRSSKKIEYETLYSDDKFSLEIHHSTTIPLISPNKQYLLEQHGALSSEIKSDVTLKELSEFIDRIQDFFVFISWSTVSLVNPLEFSDGDFNYYCYKNPRRIENSQRHKSQKKTKSLLFTVNEIPKGQISETFQKWFKLFDKYEYALKLLISCINSSVTNRENRFINLMYALDTIQQKDITSVLKNESNLSQKDSEILEKLRTTYKVERNLINSLKARLLKQNRPKLKDKIAKLLEPFRVAIETDLKENFDEFIEVIVNTRNFIAHESNKEPQIVNKDFEKYNRKLETILILIFLSKLNLSNNHVISNLHNMERYQFMMS
ncbi:hypothetical protein DNU06_16990 [Putridiphycobacter roseus]|uniref:Uncharacterized protein n=1 Tax=Putridiphycobacter roseus TaxID=2219161 RepID=A0A2W1NJ39_9FLAO|nr:HEPN domain-containing protein [Putridiphycobacter roseus]PZE15642.1 hypothetical protein DNU06_16990 [Putridiphycobacter roseus]